MTATAGRPPGAPDEASFTGTTKRSGGPRSVIVVFALGFAGLVAIGIGGRDTEVASATFSPGSSPAPASPSLAPPTPIVAVGDTPAPTLDHAPIVVSEPGRPLALTIRRHPETMYVHGDVQPPGVTWVFVNLIDADGRVAGWTSVSIPGGSGPVASDRPALRFDVELALPPWADGPLWVQATAYDATGRVVAAEQLGVWADGEPVGGDLGAGTGVGAGEMAGLVALELPAGGGAITEPTIQVRGRLVIKADSIRITLLTANRRTLSTATVRTANLDGGIRPVRAPVFDVRLGLREPRPVGEVVWVVIAAYAEDGTELGVFRRAVTIGPLGGDGAG